MYKVIEKHKCKLDAFVFTVTVYSGAPLIVLLLLLFGFRSLGGTGRDDISMQFAFRDFQPCWMYTWVAVKLPLASLLLGAELLYESLCL